MRRFLTSLVLSALALAGCHAQVICPPLTPAICSIAQPCALPHFGIELCWQAPANSSDPVVAYEAFRAPSGSSQFISLTENAPSTAALIYLDETVQPAMTYNYVVESVDASGVLSEPSNLASVTVPAFAMGGILTGITN